MRSKFDWKIVFSSEKIETEVDNVKLTSVEHIFKHTLNLYVVVDMKFKKVTHSLDIETQFTEILNQQMLSLLKNTIILHYYSLKISLNIKERTNGK